jgi:hypothetical protein
MGSSGLFAHCSMQLPLGKRATSRAGSSHMHGRKNPRRGAESRGDGCPTAPRGLPSNPCTVCTRVRPRVTQLFSTLRSRPDADRRQRGPPDRGHPGMGTVTGRISDWPSVEAPVVVMGTRCGVTGQRKEAET